jgi:hypothetical protein
MDDYIAILQHSIPHDTIRRLPSTLKRQAEGTASSKGGRKIGGAPADPERCWLGE